jgi:hypothetical protein
MASHFGVRASFLGSEEKPIGNTDLNQRGQLTNKLI